MILFLVVMGSLGACSVTPSRVDPYAGLLPQGTVLSDARPAPSSASFKGETVYIVTGANFENYAKGWNQVSERAKSVRAINSQTESDVERVMNTWSPALVTGKIVTTLKKHFRDAVVVTDLAAARNRKAQWIVMFDHAFDMPSSATSTYTNTTVVDLLDSSLRRVVHAEYSARHERGASWSAADSDRLLRQRALDIVESVDRALADFDKKVASLAAK